MSIVSACPARIEDLPNIVIVSLDDVLGKGRENIGPPLHSDYLDAFEAINDDPNQVFVVFEAENDQKCLQSSSENEEGRRSTEKTSSSGWQVERK